MSKEVDEAMEEGVDYEGGDMVKTLREEVTRLRARIVELQSMDTKDAQENARLRALCSELHRVATEKHDRLAQIASDISDGEPMSWNGKDQLVLEIPVPAIEDK